MTTATVQGKQTSRPAPITLDSWKNMLVLAQEPDRHGDTVWNIRLVLSDLPPWRYGQFKTKTAARNAFKIIAEYLAYALEEHAVEARTRAGCGVNEEY